MKNGKLLTAFCMVMFSGIAYAGLLTSFPVAVDINADGSGAAQGNMASARYSDNDVDQIGCGVRTLFDPSFGALEFGFCQAVDAEGDGAFCFTDSPDLIDTMKVMSDQSYVTFRYDENQSCTYVGFSSQSQYLGQDDDSSDD